MDDVLATGPTIVLQIIFAALRETWETTVPKYAEEGFTFCGLEITKVGDVLHLSQSKYIQDLLLKYLEIQGTATMPLPRDTEPPEEKADISTIRCAQKLVGELLWISTRSRPDTCFSVFRLGQLISRALAYVVEASKHLLKYLRGTLHYTITYGKVEENRGSNHQVVDAQTSSPVELYADASFSPGSEKSQSRV